MRRSETAALRRDGSVQTDLQPRLATMMTGQFDRITVDPDRLGGTPYIRGLRIFVGMLVEMVAAGRRPTRIVTEYPYLEPEDVREALAYSAALAESYGGVKPKLDDDIRREGVLL